MNIITVEVLCPSTERSYDFKLPVKMNTGDIKKQIIDDICNFEGLPGLFQDTDAVRLYCKDGCIPDVVTPEYAGVRNGDMLMII